MIIKLIKQENKSNRTVYPRIFNIARFVLPLF